MIRPPRDDWTRGPARIAAAAVLIAVSLAMLGWSLARPHAAPVLRAEPNPRRIPDGFTAESTRPDVALAPAATININAASSAELESLPGIGPALAGRILADREANGPFKTVEDLDRVRGIGPKTLERLRPLIRVE